MLLIAVGIGLYVRQTRIDQQQRLSKDVASQSVAYRMYRTAQLSLTSDDVDFNRIFADLNDSYAAVVTAAKARRAVALQEFPDNQTFANDAKGEVEFDDRLLEAEQNREFEDAKSFDEYRKLYGDQAIRMGEEITAKRNKFYKDGIEEMSRAASLISDNATLSSEGRATRNVDDQASELYKDAGKDMNEGSALMSQVKEVNVALRNRLNTDLKNRIARLKVLGATLPSVTLKTQPNPKFYESPWKITDIGMGAHTISIGASDSRGTVVTCADFELSGTTNDSIEPEPSLVGKSVRLYFSQFDDASCTVWLIARSF